MTPSSPEDNLRLTVPSRGEQVAGWATQVIGGPTGRYAAVGRRGISYAVTVLSALASVMVALGVGQKTYCVKNGWSAPDSLWRACYSDVAVGLNVEGGPWAKGGPGENQPVLTAILHWVLRKVVPSGSGLSVQQYYFAICAVVVALLVAATVIATAHLLRGTPWLAAHVALSPVLITASLISLDMFGVALATFGFLFWVRERPALAGIALGAATMARSYPLVIVAAIALVALRDRRSEALARMLGAGTVTAVACLAVAYLAGGDPFTVYRNWNAAGPGYGSPWFLLTLLKVDVDPSAATWLAVFGWLLALLVGAYLVRRPAHLTPLAPLALTMLVIVFVTGKSFPVQQALWILPFLALTAFRWREHLVWAGVEIVTFVITMLFIATRTGGVKGVAWQTYLIFVVTRLVAWVSVAWVSWESAEELQDHHDPESAAEADRQLVADLAHGNFSTGGDDSEIVGGPA